MWEELERRYGEGVSSVVINHNGLTNIGGDKFTKHNYSKDYELAVSLFHKKHGHGPRTIAEVGILQGVGLATMCDVFPEAAVTGFDIDLEPFRDFESTLRERGAFSRNNVQVVQFDQRIDNRKMLQRRGTVFDMVIDDGLHHENHNATCFMSFEPMLNKDGFVYLIEDVHPKYNHIDALLHREYPQYNIKSSNGIVLVTNLYP